ncbi:hypothetical protein AUEXF2481DRAFT_26056 [Aureobasidium subglaciale EXF-2481]|uniref:Pentatricopeptide repeat domain-containing protein n=1 Tax=Aureobasidium subglaciale (strain EXF-2481) TaxID=1043005 RepID=A0A074YRL6_AURSE|nr:uncharacterized protein AUEXF2481DRAFT_26056 [Aureobasidium subglaciale EXF-2481]KEQ98804.1 hypothetical protein AUEXF2481DRAFT_26056 [Aureobasidium subglaciale EXF-2481]
MPLGVSALHRGLARPSALASHTVNSTSIARSPLSPCLIRPYAVVCPQKRLPAATSVATADHVRQELENAHKGNHSVLTNHATKSGLPHLERKNFLARLTPCAPLFDRLQASSDAFSAFRYEADVSNRLGTQKPVETRLVEQPQYSQNINLWLELLRFRLRLDGQQGVTDIVQAIVHRRVVLPLHGPQVDQLWSTLLWSAVKYPQVLRCLYPYLVETLPRSGLLDIDLYRRLVAPFLRQNPMFAFKWHKSMQVDRLLPPDFVSVLAQLLQDVHFSTHKPRALEAFRKIYTSAKVGHAYDDCMLSMCRLFDFDDAVAMHTFFLQHGDYPSSAMRSMPVIAHLDEQSWLAKSNMKESARVRFEGQIREARHDFELLRPVESAVSRAETTLLSFTRENMSSIVGDVHNIKEKELNDSFCARLFATTAFSTDLIITGLRMLGLKLLGNLALREIAARVRDPAEYIATVDAIQRAGISVVDSVFSRALKSFASQPDKYPSYNFLLMSDQHPTAYENRALQKKLFASFLDSGDHSQTNAILDILTLGKPEPENYHANLILQTYARRGQRASILQILHEMRLHRIPVSDPSLHIIQWTALRPRSRSKRPITQRHQEYKDDLDFTANVFLETMRTGQLFNPSRWHEVLKRYGMENRLPALERLSVWLSLWYSGRLEKDAVLHGRVLSNEGDVVKDSKIVRYTGGPHPLAVLFTPHILRAMVAWGFKSEVSSPVSTTSPKPDSSADSLARPQGSETELVADWTRGLVLVSKLEDFGVNLEHTRLRREGSQQFRSTDGPER